MTIRSSATVFRQEVSRLNGLDCWSVLPGRLGDSILTMDFGPKVPRPQRLNNQNLSEEQQLYEGTFSLYINCAWRVEAAGQVVGGWTDATDQESLRSVIGMLPGNLVTGTDLSLQGLDLQLDLDNDAKLHLFCDQTNLQERLDNYWFFTPEAVWTVSTRSELSVEERS
jgi:hypothetical protein